MSIDILMPALSPTMEEGVLAKWHVAVGDAVKAGDVIAEIETDKATMEVEAVDEGVIEAILVPGGSEGVKINTVIARLAGEGEAPAPKAAAPAATVAAAPVSTPTPAPAAPVAQPVAAAAPVTVHTSDRVLASPLARRIALQAGVDLAAIAGTGPNGRVIKADVEAAMAKGVPSAPLAPAPAMAPASPTPAAAPVAPRPHGYPEGSYDLIPLDGMRKTIARRMTESFRDVPHFPLTIDLEIDALLALRKELNAKGEADGVKLSVNDLVIRAAALACAKVPAANASYTPEGLLLHHDAHISVAVAVDGGLVTPVIRKAQSKGLATISAEMKALAEKARARKLMPEDYAGGTISISNLGMMGIKQFASILNEPQGCILSVGAGEPRPVVKNGALAIATVMTVTLTCDHRVVDGAVGSEWLAAFRRLIEEPLTMLL